MNTTSSQVMGLLDDMWHRPITDIGAAGPDQGHGGKYLVLPPDYEGDTSEVYVETAPMQTSEPHATEDESPSTTLGTRTRPGLPSHRRRLCLQAQ